MDISDVPPLDEAEIARHMAREVKQPKDVVLLFKIRRNGEIVYSHYRSATGSAIISFRL